MSGHWKPESRERWIPVESAAPPAKSWPEGATAGLILVAAGCLALGAILYQIAGPRVVIEDEARAD